MGPISIIWVNQGNVRLARKAWIESHVVPIRLYPIILAGGGKLWYS